MVKIPINNNYTVLCPKFLEREKTPAQIVFGSMVDPHISVSDCCRCTHHNWGNREHVWCDYELHKQQGEIMAKGGFRKDLFLAGFTDPEEIEKIMNIYYGHTFNFYTVITILKEYTGKKPPNLWWKKKEEEFDGQ